MRAQPDRDEVLMTLPESDELLILAYEALENRARFDKELPDFPLFRSEWSAVHIESHGSHILSFWRGPGTEMMALLTQGQPPERTLAAVDHRPCARKPRIEPTEGSFLYPAFPLARRAAIFRVSVSLPAGGPVKRTRNGCA